MAKRIRWTEEKVRDWLKKNCNDIELVAYGGNTHRESVFRCKKDGNVWNAPFTRIKQGSGCLKCGIRSRAEKRRITEDEVAEWLKEYRPNIELVEYSGCASKKSRFRCKKCACEWQAPFVNIKQGSGCPDCICVYKKDGMTYDSRWEFVWHWCQKLYGCVWFRNEQGEDKGYYVLYRDENNKLRQFHPDFYIINPRFKKIRCYKDGVVCYVRIKMVEIKPDKGGLDKHHTIKRKVAKKYGIVFIGNEEISNAEVVLHDNGITGCIIEQYRISKEEEEKYVRNWLSENRPEIELIEYSGYVSKKSRFKCKKDKHEWETTFDGIKQGYGCPKCGGNARVTENDVNEWLKKHRPNIELVEYGGCSSKKSKFRCTQDGCEWKTTFSNIKQGQGCPKCGVRSRAKKRCITERQIRGLLNEIRPEVALVKYGGTTHSMSVFRCKKCGEVFEKSFDSLRQQKYGCSKCAKKSSAEKRRITDKQIVVWLKQHKPDIKMVEYSCCATAISKFKCKTCGNVFKKQFRVLKQQKYGCPNWRLHKQKELANGKA
jgi:predicted  nucleic acid-binding Zn-ribbon protein